MNYYDSNFYCYSINFSAINFILIFFDNLMLLNPFINCFYSLLTVFDFSLFQYYLEYNAPLLANSITKYNLFLSGSSITSYNFIIF